MLNAIRMQKEQGIWMHVCIKVIINTDYSFIFSFENNV